jgi:hypothetical protein
LYSKGYFNFQIVAFNPVYLEIFKRELEVACGVSFLDLVLEDTLTFYKLKEMHH